MAETRAVSALLYGKVHHEFQRRWLEPSSGGRSFMGNQIERPERYRGFLAVRIEPAYNRGVWRTIALGQPCRQRDPSMMGNVKLLDDRVPEDNKAVPRPFASSKLAVLRQHPYFCDLDPEAFDQLCRYAKHSTLKRGATIVSRGDPGTSLIAAISGTVKISVSSADGRSAILNLIGPGEIFGEVAVLDGLARTADVTANTNCEIFIIDRRDFLPFVRSQPALAMKFVELLCTRLGWTSDRVGEVILQDLPGRLASTLLRLTEQHKLAPGGRTIAITQHEISEMVGMTRESINKQLRAWATRNWVRLEHGAIVVLNAEMLRELAEAGSGSEDD